MRCEARICISPPPWVYFRTFIFCFFAPECGEFWLCAFESDPLSLSLAFCTNTVMHFIPFDYYSSNSSPLIIIFFSLSIYHFVQRSPSLPPSPLLFYFYLHSLFSLPSLRYPIHASKPFSANRYKKNPSQTESAREARKSFHCELCGKGYARMNEFEAHEGSYDHLHTKVRFYFLFFIPFFKGLLFSV